MSTKKPVIVALAASVVIVCAVFVGAILLFNPHQERVDPVDQHELAMVPDDRDDDPGATAVEGAKPDIKIVDSDDRARELLTVRVTETDGKRIRDASLIVRKSAEGERLGEIVFPVEGKLARSGSGEFQVRLVAGAYTVRAWASGYTQKRQAITVIEGSEKSVEIVLTQGLSISGRVFDKAGRPIEGARVVVGWELGSPEDDMISKLIAMTTIAEKSEEFLPPVFTTSDGSYQVDGLNPEFYTVIASASGHTPVPRKNIRPTARNVNFKLPDGSKLDVSVVDQQGAPVPGALVSVFPQIDSQDIFEVIATKSRPPLMEQESDSSGNVSVTSLGSGLFNFEITAPGFQTGRFMEIAVYEGRNEPRTFVLKAGLLLAGEVVDDEGQPIVGAWIKPLRQGGDVRAQNIKITFRDGRVQTGDEGQFEFNTLEAGRFSLVAWHDDFAAKQLRNIELGNMALKITLSRGGAVSGAVYEASTGKTVAGARVVVNDILDVKKRSVTGENGEYYIGGLSASKQRGKRFVNVHADGYARINNHQIKVEEGKVTEGQDFELFATAGVAGRVINSQGETVARARIMAKRKSTGTSPVPVTVGSGQTDKDGRFSIDSVEAGDETWLTIMHPEYIETESGTFDISPNQELDVGDLTLTLGGSVMGVAVGPKGGDVEGVRIDVRLEGDTTFTPVKSDTTDRRGRFKIPGLLAGEIDLRATHPGYLEEILQGVEIQEGLTTTDVRIELRKGNGLSGVVRDRDDQLVRGATVIVREIASGLSELRTTTNGQGRFSFNNLAGDDPVVVEVEHPDYSPYSAQGVEVGSVLVIELDTLGGVRGVVVGPDNEPMNSFSVQPQNQGQGGGSKNVHARTFQNANGSFEFQGISAGTYKIAVNAPGYSATNVPDVVIQNGELVDIGRVVLQEGGIIDGQVVDAISGQPVSGARIRVQGGRVKFMPMSKNPGDGKSSASKTTDQNGRFKFTSLRGGKVTLVVDASGYVTARAVGVDSNDATSSRGLEIAVEHGGGIFGTVVDASGRPRRGMNVYLTGTLDLAKDSTVNQRKKSDSSGYFSFEGLRSGGYRVTAHNFKIKQRPSVDVDIESGDTVEVELVLGDQ